MTKEQLDRMEEKLDVCLRQIPYQSNLLAKFRIGLLVASMMGSYAMGCASESLGQERSPCPKKWNKVYKTLDIKDTRWVLSQTDMRYEGRDLDGDGLEDKVMVTSKRWIRGCDAQKYWLDKENTIRIEYTSRPDQQYTWRGGLVREFTIRPDEKTITFTEESREGVRTMKRIDYSEERIMHSL